MSGTCSDKDDVGETVVRVRSLHTIGKNWSLGARLGPLWTLIYHPLAGIFVTFLIAVVDVPTPRASATTFWSGYTTAPCFTQLPELILAGCVLLGARPISEIFTVNPCLVGSQLMFAIPWGTCFRVALAMLLLVAPVDVDADVDDEAGAEVVPPHPVSSSTATMPSPAIRLIFRFVKYCVTITMPFIYQNKPDKTDARGRIDT